MRSTTYRFWNPERKSMFYPKDYLGLSKMFKDIYEGSNYEIMQYTGKKDKNGVNIYEGDIIKIIKDQFDNIPPKNDSIFVVDFSEGSYMLVTIPDGFSRYKLRSMDDIEVIGNIYETPELLKTIK